MDGWVCGWINEHGQGLYGTKETLLILNLKSTVMWRSDPLGPVFTGDQPSVASQQGPTTHEGCSLAQGSLTTVVVLGLTETSNVVKVSQRPPRVGSISRQSMP